MKTLFYRVIFPLSRIMFLTCCRFCPPPHPQPFKDKNSVRPLGKGIKNGILADGGWTNFLLMGFKLCKNPYLVASTKKFIKYGQTKVEFINVICESES